MLCCAITCVAAGGSAPTYSLIVGPRIELGPIQGVPTNLGYAPVSGLIADLNGDGHPDIVIGINGSPPAVYLSNGTADIAALALFSLMAGWVRQRLARVRTLPEM
jgi:hypothetical protein